MSIIEKVQALELPLGQYVVIGSGIMDALGIRAANDMDIAVLPELHEKLRTSGKWQQEVRYGKVFLLKGNADINPELSWSEYPTTTQEAIDSATIIDGIPFMNLQELKKFKTAMGRAKDLDDIELINNYYRDE